MPISAKRFTEYKYRISELFQKRDWEGLLRVCCTEDYDQKRSIAAIFSLHDPANVWRLVKWSSSLSVEKRRELREGIATICLIIGKIGQTNLVSSLAILRKFLSDDHMLRLAVSMSLSNLWVLESKRCAKVLFQNWILGSEDNEDLQEIATSSIDYLASQDSKLARPFLVRVASLATSKPAFSPAGREANVIMEKYSMRGKSEMQRALQKLRR
jgi:hypothetical protein